ncbi:MAG: hypothetical protein ACRERC_21070 [Candidatus Binatia bacterium]
MLMVAAAAHGSQPSGGFGITPEMARALYDRLTRLPAVGGCAMDRFDTRGSRIEIGLRAPSGVVHTVGLDPPLRPTVDGRGVGAWTVAAGAEAERDCAGALAAYRQAFAEPVPLPARAIRVDAHTMVLWVSFVLAVLGTVWVLVRELRAHRPSPFSVAALALIWAAALGLRLDLSPRTFLHEYYHIAETIEAYLPSERAPTAWQAVYGNTGPALFRFVATLLGRPDDVQIIFLTNAVVASLAIPAVALLALTLTGSWAQALCAAVLLGVLPQHLRFSAAEDLFVQAVTFGLWALALFALYMRTRRLGDALLAALVLSIAMQTRPEMLFLPAAVAGMLLVAAPRRGRLLAAPGTLLAAALVVALLVPRLLGLYTALTEAPPPAASVPELGRYAENLVLFQGQVTPAPYWILLAVGLAWGLWTTPGLILWLVAVFAAWVSLSLAMGTNAVFNLRTQLLPMTVVVLIAAGVAPLWMRLWRRQPWIGVATGLGLLAALAAGVVWGWRGFVVERRDQQLEWAFLERTVPRLPDRAVLLASIESGRHVDVFPQFLLRRDGKSYELVDVWRAADGAEPWPAPGADLLYYQGMFCYFAFPDEPSPDPMTRPCRAVHERYVLDPVFVEDLHTQGYSALRYAGDGTQPFRVGFYRLSALR